MSQLKEELVLDAGGFNREMDEATGKVEKFDDASKKAGDSIKQMGDKGAMSTKDLLREIGKLSGAERSVTNYRRQLAQMTKDISDLTIQYRQMSSEMQNSDLGRATIQRIEELKKKAGEYKDAILDSQAAIKNLASDTANWDAARQGIQLVTGSLQAFATIGLISGKNTDELVQALSKLKAVESATQGIIRIGNALQRQSSLMLKINTLQTAALAKAKDLEAAATGRATIAQRAFNLVAKANPYVLLASALIAVGGALLFFTKKSKEAKKAEEENQKILEENKRKLDDYATTVGTAAGKVQGTFQELRKKYSELQSTLQKTQFIKDNKKAFDELGISLTSINDADNVFINNADAFEQAVVQRARAAAMFTLIQKNWEEYGESIEKLRKGEQKFKPGQILQSNMIQGNHKPWELGQTDRHMGQDYVTLNQAGADKLNAEWIEKQREKLYQQLLDSNKVFQDEMDAANAEFDAILSKYGIKKAGGNGDNNITTKLDIKPDTGSLKEAQDKVNELQNILNNMAPNNAKFEETKGQLEEWKNKLEELKKLYNLSEETKKTESELDKLVSGSLAEATYFVKSLTEDLNNMSPDDEGFNDTLSLLQIWSKRQKEIQEIINGTDETVQGSLEEANKKVQELQNKLAKTVPDTEEFKKLLAELDKWKKKQEEITEAIDGSKTKLEQYNNLLNSVSNVKKGVEIGLYTSDEGQAMIDDLKKEFTKLGLKIPISIDINNIDGIQREWDKFTNTITTPIKAIETLGNSYKNMIDKMEDPNASEWDKFWSVMSYGETVISTVSTLLGVMSTVQEMVAQAKNRTAQATISETTAEAAAISTKTAEAGANVTLAATAGGAAAAEGASSVASVPYVGPILAIAAIATIMAAILGMLSTVQGFATGGVVGGNSYTGDKILARLNSGELILNTAQQDALYKELNTPYVIDNQDFDNNIGGQVEFKIKGTELVGVLNNYNKKSSRI